MAAKKMKLVAVALLCLLPMATSNPLWTLGKRLAEAATLALSTTNHFAVASPPEPRGCWQLKQDLVVPNGLIGTHITYCDKPLEPDRHIGFDRQDLVKCGGSCNTWVCEHLPDEHGLSKIDAPHTECIDANKEVEFFVCDMRGGCNASDILQAEGVPVKRDGRLLYNTPAAFMVHMRY